MAEFFNGNMYDNFAFNPSSLGNDWKSGSQPPVDLRPLGFRMSTFNINYGGPRNPYNYGRTLLTYSFKGKLEGPFQPNTFMGIGYGTDPGYFKYNPYIWGLAVAHLRMLNDTMFMMGMYHSGKNLSKYHDSGADLAYPRLDVSDTKGVKAEGMLNYHNYPTEGWSSFGKKRDKERPWIGNSWVNGII